MAKIETSYSIENVRRAIVCSKQKADSLSALELTILCDVETWMIEKGYTTIRDDQVSISTRRVLSNYVEPLS